MVCNCINQIRGGSFCCSIVPIMALISNRYLQELCHVNNVITLVKQGTGLGLLDVNRMYRVGPGQSLDGRPDAAGSGVGWPVGGTLSSGLKKYPNAPGQ